ncbi:hypothetical protein C8R44DRAFT_731970 [Mycena epipterygia]|nr:hypothetical protein C8R44DRAFT_731970 [Mycena epipterygia]
MYPVWHVQIISNRAGFLGQINSRTISTWALAQNSWKNDPGQLLAWSTYRGTPDPGLETVEYGRTGGIRTARALRLSEPGTQMLDQEEILKVDDIQNTCERLQMYGGFQYE